VRPSDWNSVHNNTFQLTGSEIASLFKFGGGLESTSGADGISVSLVNIDFYQPFMLPLTGTTSHTPGIGTWYFDDIYLPYGLNKGILRVPITCSTSHFYNAATFACDNTTKGGAVSMYQTFYHNLALYTPSPGESYTRLSTYWTGQVAIVATQVKSVGSVASNSAQIQVSNYLTIGFPSQWDSAGGFVTSTVTASGTISAAATSLDSSSINSLISAAETYIAGSRMDIFGFNTTIPAGNYVLAHQFWSTSNFTTFSSGSNFSAGTMISTHVRVMMLEQNFGGWRQLGVSSSNTLSQGYPWHGYVTTSQSTAYSTIATSDLRATNVRLYWNHERETA